MTKFARILVSLAGIGLCVAREISRSVETLNDNSDRNNESTNLTENRKHKPYHDLFLSERKSGFSIVCINPLRDIYFMGGLQSLVTFVLIKIKVIVIAATIIGFIVLALKLFGLLKYTNYFYKNDYPPIVLPSHEFSSYPGTPLSSYSSYHHHEDANDWPDHSEHYARSSAVKFAERINMTEIAYSLANIDNEDCRARLICEFEVMLTKSPFLHYLTRQIVTRKDRSGWKGHTEDCSGQRAKCLGSTKKRSNERAKKKTRENE